MEPIINIWGSCVSREILNFTDKAKTGYYILQNPIHTVGARPIPISDGQICAGSPFTKRMVQFDFSKCAKEEFAKHSGDFLMIDTADCRYGWYEFRKKPGARVCASPSGTQTVRANFTKLQVRGRGSTEISTAEWENYVEEFCSYICSLYPEERIIINHFCFAEKYQGENGLTPYPTLERDRSWQKVTDCVERLFRATLKNALVLETDEAFVGDPNHRLGFSALHYTDRVYSKQAKELERLLKMAEML